MQSHWADTDPLPGNSRHTTAARVQFRELQDTAGRVLHVPSAARHDDARALVRAVLARRITITLDPPAPDEGWCDAVFTPDAIEVLARRCLDRNLRQVLTDVRDTFDHHDRLPDRIEREHLIDAMSA